MRFDSGDYEPSESYINKLMERNGLNYMSFQVVEDKTIDVITPEIV